MNAPCAPEATIQIQNLTQGYKRRTVLANLSLEVGVGVLGVLGPNGAGKTTLLQTLSTAVPPRSGKVRLLGWDAADPRARQRIRRRLGVLPQQFGFFPHFSVREFVEYCAWLREVPDALIPDAAERAISTVDLGGVAKQRMGSLSGGMVRRAGIAQAIVNDPGVLILDEPTAGLDPEQRVEFRAMLRKVGQTAAVVVATHLVEDVAAACDGVVVIHGGEVVFRGMPEGLASAATESAAGDTPLERGYSSVVACSRARQS